MVNIARGASREANTAKLVQFMIIASIIMTNSVCKQYVVCNGWII